MKLVGSLTVIFALGPAGANASGAAATVWACNADFGNPHQNVNQGRAQGPGIAALKIPNTEMAVCCPPAGTRTYSGRTTAVMMSVTPGTTGSFTADRSGAGPGAAPNQGGINPAANPARQGPAAAIITTWEGFAAAPGALYSGAPPTLAAAVFHGNATSMPGVTTAIQ
jgi:hypothetical protein